MKLLCESTSCPFDLLILFFHFLSDALRMQRKNNQSTQSAYVCTYMRVYKKKSKANIIPFTAVRGDVQIVYITEANDHILSRGRTDATPAQNTQSLLLLRPWHVAFTSNGV